MPAAEPAARLNEAIQAYEQGDYAKTRDLCRSILAGDLPPEDRCESCLYLGHALLALGDQVGANDQFRQALALRPPREQQIHLHYELGVGLYKLGDTNGARIEYLQAVNQFAEPASENARITFVRAVLGLTIEAYGRREYAEALNWAERASQAVSPQTVENALLRSETERWRGSALFHLRRLEECIPVLKVVLDHMEPGDAGRALVAAHLGLALCGTGRYDEAFLLLREVEVDRTAQPHIWAATRVWLGNLHYRRNEFAEALEQFEKVIDLPAEDWAGSRESLARMIDCYVDAGKYDQAVAVGERAYRELRGNDLVHVEYAKALANVGRADEARRVLDELDEATIDPGLRERFLAHSAYVAVRQQDRTRAEDLIAKLRAFNPFSRYLHSVKGALGDLPGEGKGIRGWFQGGR